MQLLLLYSTIFVPFSIAFFDSESTPVIVLNCVIDILFMTDFMKTFVTAEEIQGGLVISPKTLFRYRVASVWFAVDLVACFPSELLVVSL